MKTKLYDVLGTMFEINDVGFKRSAKFENALLFSNAKAFIFIVDLTHFDQTVQGEKKRKSKMVSDLSTTCSAHPKRNAYCTSCNHLRHVRCSTSLSSTSYKMLNEYHVTILNAD